MSLPLLLNIIVLVLSCYLSIRISQRKISYQSARNLQLAILFLDGALMVVNFLMGSYLIAILWGVILFTNLYAMGIIR